jgi:DNA-binding NarL/FixJ family response regulator
MSAPRVLLVVAHPVIAAGIETLLRLEGDYDVKRVSSLSEAAGLRDWSARVALVDGTLLNGSSRARIGAPAYVLSGNERDGRELARKLDDGRGWLRKDATGPELATAIGSLPSAPERDDGIGRLGVATVAILCVIVIALVAYLVWLAVY